MKQAFLKLHLSILIAGFTGIFGKLITLREVPLIWYRMIITICLLYIILGVCKKLQKISLNDFIKIGSTGALLTLHWFFFYGSIKASNVSIGVICFSLCGLFTAIFEPIFHKKRISSKELLFSLITLAGIFLIFHFDTRYRTGIILGVISSAFASIFTIANKEVGKNHKSSTILLYEMIGGFIFVSIVLPFYVLALPDQILIPDTTNLIYLLLFSLFCTVWLYLLQIQVLKSISAFTVNLSYNLEPVYSIILAMIIFKEANDLNFSFYFGLGLIILSVVLQMWSVVAERNKVKLSA